MLHSCGQTHFKSRINRVGFSIDANNIDIVDNYQPTNFTTTTIQLYTSYLGQVNIQVSDIKDTISLENYHTVNNKKILVKVVDAEEHNLSDQNQYTLNKLKSLSSKKININDNKYYYVLTLLCTKKLAQVNNNATFVSQLDELIKPFLNDKSLIEKTTKEYPDLIESTPTKSINQYKKIYQKVVFYNSFVDIFFSTCNYLDFLFENTNIVSVNGLDSLISINGVPNLDNAFFTGEYMVYGSGSQMFYPMTSLDVIGHELSHGLVSGTANLEYKGHSGALNESFADIMGTMFEFYMYEKYPNLQGKKDWLIGEDLCMDKPFLRSMEDPNKGQQPDKYKGTYYLDPNSQIDFGGVHTNSGITNYCFYLACQQKDKSSVLKTFIKCLKNLTKNSNFIDFRDKLKIASENDPIISSVLNKVGLNDSVISDYNYNQPQPQPQPQPKPQPIPQPQPQRYPLPQPQPQRYPLPIPQPQRYPLPIPQPQRYPPRYFQYQHQYPMPSEYQHQYPISLEYQHQYPISLEYQHRYPMPSEYQHRYPMPSEYQHRYPIFYDI